MQNEKEKPVAKATAKSVLAELIEYFKRGQHDLAALDSLTAKLQEVE